MALQIKSSKPEEPKVHFVQKVIGGDTWLVMAQSTIELEDEFSNLYYTTSSQSKIFLAPPFDPNVLLTFANTNNILKQCIEAMEVNIDGTGITFVGAAEGEEPDAEEVKRAREFFGEPYPNESFTKIRRKLRSTLESVGYAFLEILRNMGGDVVGFRNIETHHIRFVKLDEPVLVKKKIQRNGQEVEISFWERERRFAQRVALKDLIYYREYGSTRNVDRITGQWETSDQPIPSENKGSELLVFGISPDVTTPYFVPRWVNQLPSVIGSRKAEEQNLQFLDSGGLPPAIIFVQGGTLAKNTSDQLRMYLSGQNKNKYRAVVVEVQSSSGSLDSAGSVQVKVERFGSQAAQDAMFMKYDNNTEEHVRVGFRLPSLFIGRNTDYNFATAVSSYLVAEAQVFSPEREAFDELINKTLIKELGFKTLKIKSNPITISDITSQLKGLELSKDMATRESFLKEINIATGMSLNLASLSQETTVSSSTEGKQEGTVPHEKLPASTQPLPSPLNLVPLLPRDQTLPNQNKKVKTASELVDLAMDFAVLRGLVQKREILPERIHQMMKEIQLLEGEDKRVFDSLLASFLYGDLEAGANPDLRELASYLR